ncbi:MAG: hypothetical protein KDD35_03425 [Bdellovibrionales bacterium]|nr:hypothetical protein [Bdellovibrionales bacterium]
MKLLLLAGDGNANDGQPTQALRPCSTGEIQLDRSIRNVKQLGFCIYVVLNQGNGEDVLRSSKELPSCELIFDPNDNSEFFSLLKAGCFALEERFFVWALNLALPDPETFSRLDHHFCTKAHASPYHLIRPYSPSKGNMIPGFPLLITRDGIKLFRSERIFTSFEDPRLQYSRVPILTKTFASSLATEQRI